MNKGLMLLAAAAVGLGTANATAFPVRTLPGMMCQKIDGTGTPSVGWQGSMFNVSTTADLRISCPIVRDDPTSKPQWISVAFIDANPSETGFCQFYNTDGGDNVIWGVTTYTSTTFQGTDTQFLSLSPVSASQDASEFLFCKIPPMHNGYMSMVVNYQVQE